MEARLSEAGGHQPALVTVIPWEGKAERVKLVFEHRQFKRPSMAERWRRRRAGQHVDVPAELAAIYAKRLRVAEQRVTIDLPEDWDRIEAEGEEVTFVACPRGTVAVMPKGVTTAKVILWPALGSVPQGDGDHGESGKVIAEGFSVCAWMDNFSKREAREKALHHLLETASLPGPVKGILAACYAHRPRGGRR